LRLRDIAAEAGLSVYHLCRTFRKATGQSLHGYRSALRLRHALEAIRAGERLVDVALNAGFSSHSHFTAAFRAAYGKTPASLRG
jgi:AraC family transcriptional regulator